MNKQRQEYVEQMKAKYPEVVFLFKEDIVYKAYAGDAVKTAEILGITLTSEETEDGGTVEMAGFPTWDLDTALPRLVQANKRVAICEDLKQ